MKINKLIISYICLIAAILIGFLAMYLPPIGIIDNSVLWFVAQLLVFISSILGLDYHVFNARKVS